MLIGEVILITGWQVDYVLSMPATQFFSIRKILLDLKRKEYLQDKINSCDIQAISIGGSNFYSELRKGYQEDLIGKSNKKNDPRVFDADNEDEAKKAADVLASTFATKKRLMGL